MNALLGAYHIWKPMESGVKVGDATALKNDQKALTLIHQTCSKETEDVDEIVEEEETAIHHQVKRRRAKILMKEEAVYEVEEEIGSKIREDMTDQALNAIIVITLVILLGNVKMT
ncbi:hypothetical protein BUALT_Bualt08G0049100 [Buddleja alternifolia]|uniref:Uncharacterized protein n=1 Tax=Buddleja alternifolia TaxID=168488 RepID=A0AAV6XAD7_9LAMI|nr:hypothetical protein BUALT_Bualt08G0049100 [Buddleja alternifolia]